MTEKELRQAVVNTVEAWKGKKESDGSHKSIIDIYNTYRPLPRGYRMNYNDSWCAATVSAAGIQTGLDSIIPVECSCNEMIKLFKKHTHSKFEENEAITPDIADIIFYDWDDSGIGDDTGAPEHVGIVAKVSGKTITVIEGNYSDALKERTLTINGRYIRGYGLPNYAYAAQNQKSTAIEKYKTTIQKHCNFSNPDGVFSLTDKSPWAEDLYRKWAESYD